MYQLLVPGLGPLQCIFWLCEPPQAPDTSQAKLMLRSFALSHCSPGLTALPLRKIPSPDTIKKKIPAFILQ